MKRKPTCFDWKAKQRIGAMSLPEDVRPGWLVVRKQVKIRVSRTLQSHEAEKEILNWA